MGFFDDALSVGSRFVDPLDITGFRDKRRKDANGRAIRDSFNNIPDFERITDADGNLRDNLRVANAGSAQIRRANSALGRLEGLTNFREGTPIARRLLEVQNTANRQAVNNIAAQQAGQLNQGISSLARQGGVSSGARERLASNSFNQGLLARQNQAAQNQQIQQRIGADDATRQLGILQRLPGQRQNIAEFQRQGRAIDVNSAIGDIRAANDSLIKRAGSLSEALLQNQNAPRGGLGGIIDGIFG